MKKIRAIFKIIGSNWTALFYFGIVYKIFGFTVVFPFIRYLLSFLPRFAGQGYLSQENMGEVFKNPQAFFLGILILMVSALYTACEITAFMVLCERGWHHEKISLLQLCGQTVLRTARLLKPDKAGVFFMLPVLMLSVFSPVSGYLKNIRIPEFIFDFLQSDSALFGIFLGVLAVFHILLLLYLFGFPSMLFEGDSFLESWRTSLKLLHKRKLKIAGTVIALTGGFLLLFLMFFAAFLVALGWYTRTAFAEDNTEGIC